MQAKDIHETMMGIQIEKKKHITWNDTCMIHLAVASLHSKRRRT